jgi:hypothetical protein
MRVSRACWVTASAGTFSAVVVAALGASWASESGWAAVGVVLSGRVDAELERLRTAPGLLPLRLAEYANASRYALSPSAPMSSARRAAGISAPPSAVGASLSAEIRPPAARRAVAWAGRMAGAGMFGLRRHL